MSYLEDKVDVWIENSIKETRMAAKCQTKEVKNVKIKRTRNWISRMDSKLVKEKVATRVSKVQSLKDLGAYLKDLAHKINSK